LNCTPMKFISGTGAALPFMDLGKRRKLILGRIYAISIPLKHVSWPASSGRQTGIHLPIAIRSAPPKPETNGSEPSVVNLFLHGVTPNPALRNHEAPYRDAGGRRRSNAPLALDLHYLLSAHGGEAIREIGLGAAMPAAPGLGEA